MPARYRGDTVARSALSRLLILAPITEQMREVLAKHVQEALMRIFLQMYDIKLAARHFEETFNLVHLKENTIFTTY